MTTAAVARINIEQFLAVHGKSLTAEDPVAGYDRVALRDVIYPGFFTREYMNFGYWDETTVTRRQASDNLMAKIAARIPDGTGRVLDVACGIGFTTRYLIERGVARRIHAVNISHCQLAISRRTAPLAGVCRMDAVRLAFRTESFDAVVCVEAAFHFNTRERFISEAYRVLKRGGILLLTDLLLHEDGHAAMPGWLPSNFVPSLDAYRELVSSAGFSRVDVTDITEQGLCSYLRAMFRQVHEDWLAGVCDYVALQAALKLLHRVAATHKWNLFCVAVK